MPLYLSYLARAHAGLGQFEKAWRCIDEAMTAAQKSKERWHEAEIYRLAYLRGARERNATAEISPFTEL
jgi:hypothetical protein